MCARLVAVWCVLFALHAAQASAQSRSRSIGTANDGRLEHAVRLRETPDLRLQPTGRADFFTTEELASMLQRAAARVREQHRGPRALVGALSAQRGGRIAPHRSHRNGRDADVGLFLLDAEGAPVEAGRFVAMGSDGCGDDRGTRYCLDAERTFAFLAAMLEDPTARVQWFLIAEDVRSRILEAGRQSGTPEEFVLRVAITTEPHGGSERHRDHVHLRIYCAEDDRPRCVDTPPYHAWYEGTPPVSPAARARARLRARRHARGRPRASSARQGLDAPRPRDTVVAP